MEAIKRIKRILLAFASRHAILKSQAMLFFELNLELLKMK